MPVFIYKRSLTPFAGGSVGNIRRQGIAVKRDHRGSGRNLRFAEPGGVQAENAVAFGMTVLFE
jgi:hypothetical protein